MKGIGKVILFSALIGICAPWLLLGVFEVCYDSTHTVPSVIVTLPTEETQTAAVTNIYVQTESGVIEMNIEDYVVGVLLCELPESFSLEAKKAQAVAARTYALRLATMSDKHPQHAVCISSACCQGYTAPEDYRGTDAGVTSARQAVEETSGLVLFYGGRLIDATYFSCSGGRTEEAVAVWGADIPYLQSVTSPGEESALHFTDTVTYSLNEFLQLLSISQSQTSADLFGYTKYTDGGGIAEIQIGDRIFTGTQLRTLLGLRSTAFTASIVGTNVIITTRGYGHRVGMSQYGAEAMALRGDTYQDILSHYYQGIELRRYEE